MAQFFKTEESNKDPWISKVLHRQSLVNITEGLFLVPEVAVKPFHWCLVKAIIFKLMN